MSDPGAAASRLSAGAVDVLPEGRLAEQLAAAEREGRPLRVKLGIDPTAPDIHLGHVVVLRKLRQFQDAGHTVVLIVGDYTARVGDPSGRSAERPVLSDEQIDANATTFREQAMKVLDAERTETRMNSEWLSMGSDELFGIARRFTVARLLERDDFQKRMAADQPISVLELLYPVLQGYDSVAIEADLELGGTDQKFNLLFGRDVQGSFGVPEQSVLTMPILPGTDGVRRMSKSLGNYVGVADPPEEMFGKLMSVPDDVMGTYYELLLGESLDPGRHPMEAKRELGRRIVEWFWDADAAAGAERRFDQVHVEGGTPDEMPVIALDGGDAHLPALIADGFGISRSEARRIVAQGGVKLDGEAVDPDRLDLPAAELEGRVLQVGKRRFARLRGHG
ncbi:MAG TPA: tyrosine--tRNA ligase [Solirubrobacterales bacterium]